MLDPATRFATIEPYENLGLAYLASSLRQHGHEVRMLSTTHENLSIRQTIRGVLQFNPALVGITVLGANTKRAMNLVHHLRENGYRGHITLGGYYPTFHATELMRGFPAIDSIVRNEGEMTLLDLLEHLPDGDLSEVLGLSYRECANVKENPQRPFTKTIDELPFPARDFTPHVLRAGSFIHVSTSRGCYANCSFCSIAKLKIYFSIACRANNIERNLFQKFKALGLEKVFVGIESGHQRGLDTFDKEVTVEMNNQALALLRELDLMYDVGFILIDPYTTYDELKQNWLYLLEQKSYFKKRGSYLSVSNALVAYGGTPIYDRLVQERRLLGDYFNGFYYQIADKDVRRFQFIMDTIMDGLFFKVYSRSLF